MILRQTEINKTQTVFTATGIFWHTAVRQTQDIFRKELGLRTLQTFLAFSERIS